MGQLRAPFSRFQNSLYRYSSQSDVTPSSWTGAASHLVATNMWFATKDRSFVLLVSVWKQGLTWLNVVAIHSYALTAPPHHFSNPPYPGRVFWHCIYLIPASHSPVQSSPSSHRSQMSHHRHELALQATSLRPTFGSLRRIEARESALRALWGGSYHLQLYCNLSHEVDHLFCTNVLLYTCTLYYYCGCRCGYRLAVFIRPIELCIVGVDLETRIDMT